MNFVRKWVSGDKKRYISEDYNLDLSYITPRIVAMAFPASGFESVYRNKIEDVSKFIKEKHGSNFLIINLSNRKYDYTKFDNQVEEYEWVDHHAPPLPTLFTICVSMKNFLKKNEKNVVFVNCQAGKGRTGTIICCFLLFSGYFTKPDDCFDYYSYKRFQRGQGVTQPSQRRYVNYFYAMLNKNYEFPYIINIVGIYLNKPQDSIKQYIKPFIQFFTKNADHCDYTNEINYFEQRKIFANDSNIIQITNSDFSFTICGDITIKIYNKKMVKAGKIGRISFNTAFLDPNDKMLTFNLKDIDPDNLIKNPKIPRDFQIIVKYKLGKFCQNEDCIHDNLCEKCQNKLQREIKEWKDVQKIIQDWKGEQNEQNFKEKGKILLFGSEKSDFKEVMLILKGKGKDPSLISNEQEISLQGMGLNDEEEEEEDEDEDFLNTSANCIII